MSTELETPAASPVGTPDNGTTPESEVIATEPTGKVNTDSLPGSPAKRTERFAKAVTEELAPKAATAKAGAAKPDADAAKAAPVDETKAQLDALAKAGRLKFTAEGTEHVVKSAEHLQQLLAQGQKFGTVTRDLAETKKERAEYQAHVEKTYGPWDKRFESDPQFAEINGWMFNDPRLSDFAHRVLSGKATPEEAAAISKGLSFVDKNLIRATIAERSLNETAEAKERAAKLEAANKRVTEDLQEIQNSFGFRFWDEQGQQTEEGQKLFEELRAMPAFKAMVRAGEEGVKPLVEAFKLHPQYAKSIEAKKEAEAKLASDAKEAERKQRQSKIKAASGASGGTAKASQTIKPGSPENRLARFSAAMAADLGA